MVLADPNLPGREATLSEGSLQTPWSVQDSAALYGLERWGAPYFSINPRGHISVEHEESGEAASTWWIWWKASRPATSICPC